MSALKILVVDDNPDNTDVADLILTACGHHVTTRFNGQEVLTLAIDQGQTFDLILLDVAMPVLDGFAVLHRLRAHGPTRATPIICVSAKASGASEQDCLKAGADAFLNKPYRRRDLLAIIDRVLRSYGVLKPDESIAG